MSKDVVKLLFTYLGNKCHQQIPDLMLIQMGAISILSTRVHRESVARIGPPVRILILTIVIRASSLKSTLGLISCLRSSASRRMENTVQISNLREDFACPRT